MNYENLFLLSLLLTVLIEVFVLIIYIKYFLKNENDIKLLIFSGVLASGLTLPYLWFVLPSYILNRDIYIIIGEISIFIIESLIYFILLKIKIKEAIVVSLLANLTSFLVGLLVF